MQFAVNYSPQTAALLQAGRVQIDLFKCPAWPDLVAEVQEKHPVYVHFSLLIGRGQGDAFTSKDTPPDWRAVEHFLKTTQTRKVNLHISPWRAHYGNGDPRRVLDADQISAQLIRDVEGVARRFGKENVIIENGYRCDDHCLLPATRPEIARQVVEATGCGFLFDLSHARLAARHLGEDARDYISRLPLAHIQELHITGIQHFGSFWIERMRMFGVEEDVWNSFAERQMDHLPLTGDDWPYLAWASEQIRSGAWGSPQIVAVECGGVGPFWQAITLTDALAEQLPKIHRLFKG